MAADAITNQMILTPSGVAAAIRFMRDTGISFYVHGAPGISKSAVAKQEANRAGIAFIDFRLTSVAPEDVRGVPALTDAGGITGMFWTCPLVFPRDLDLMGIADIEDTGTIKFYNPIGNNGIHYCRMPEISVQSANKLLTVEIVMKKLDHFVVSLKDAQGQPATGKVVWMVTGKSEGILGLEEFNSAEPAVMAAAYQLILDRRIGDYVVPDGVMIMAMGNREGDKGITHKIPKPVGNRFVHVEMIVNFDDWQQWAIEQQISSDVLGYLSKWPSKLFNDSFASIPDLPWESPRTWEFVSRMVSKKAPEHPDVLRAVICGAIGNTTGTDFLQHRKYMRSMPDVQRIFDGSLTTFNPSDLQYKMQIAYSTCVEMCYALKRESDEINRKYNGVRLDIDKSPERIEWVKKMDRALRYAMDNFSPDVIIVMNKMAMQTYNLRFSSSSMKTFLEFCAANRIAVLGA